MSTRRTLPNRRYTETFSFQYSNNGGGPRRYFASVSFFDDGSIAELFVNTEGKAGSESDVNCSDGAVAVSLALQHGCPLEVLRSALKRRPDGEPQGPIARALDICASGYDWSKHVARPPLLEVRQHMYEQAVSR